VEELRAIVSEGAPAVLAAMVAALGEEIESPEAVTAGLWAEGLDALSWVAAESTPDMAYLCSAPVSYPLVFITQIAHYAVALRRAGATQEQMVGVFKGMTGHSQGVVAAAVIASATSDVDLCTKASVAAKYMLWQGTRCHQVLNETVVYSGVQPEASPMMAVAGLTGKALAKVVAAFNAKTGASVVSGKWSIRITCSVRCLRCAVLPRAASHTWWRLVRRRGPLGGLQIGVGVCARQFDLLRGFSGR
jgi:fatty acid synthase subunit beta